VTSNPATAAATAAAGPTSGTKQTRQATPKLRTDGVSSVARRHATAILEVLAGVRTPTEVAQQLAISLTRYYLIESRALQGLLQACEPRPQGRVRTPASELAALRRECEQLRRQAARQQALLRVTERTIGLAATTTSPTSKTEQKTARKRRQRKPKARALAAASVLRETATAALPTADHGLSP
jgi:hypothetical protein